MAWSQKRMTKAGWRWYIYERVNGRQVCLGPAGATTQKQADKAATVKSAEKIQGKLQYVGSGPLSGEGTAKFMLATTVAESTKGIYKRAFRLMLDHFGTTKRLSAITKADMLNFRDALLQKQVKTGAKKNYSVNGIRIIMSHLRAFFSFCVKRGELAANPCDGILEGFKEVPVWRLLRADEVIKLAHAFADSQELWDMVTLALMTGLRIGRIVAATKENYRCGRLYVGKNKNKNKDIEVPIKIEVRGIFGRVESGPIFPGWTQDGLESAFRKRVKKANIGRVRFHDLRHTFASNYLRHCKNANLRQVQELLGQTSFASTQRYVHLEPNDYMDKVEMLPSVPALPQLPPLLQQPDSIVAAIVADSGKQGANVGNTGQDGTHTNHVGL